MRSSRAPVRHEVCMSSKASAGSVRTGSDLTVEGRARRLPGACRSHSRSLVGRALWGTHGARNSFAHAPGLPTPEEPNARGCLRHRVPRRHAPPRLRTAPSLRAGCRRRARLDHAACGLRVGPSAPADESPTGTATSTAAPAPVVEGAPSNEAEAAEAATLAVAAFYEILASVQPTIATDPDPLAMRAEGPALESITADSWPGTATRSAVRWRPARSVRVRAIGSPPWVRSTLSGWCRRSVARSAPAERRCDSGW